MFPAAQRARARVRIASWLRGVWCGFALIAVFCAVAPSPQALFAKKKEPPSRTITGQVMDKASNPISGAAVELNDLTSGKKIAIYSQEDGSYQFAGLRLDHDYELQAHYQGEASEVRKVSSVEPRNRVVINLRIPPDNP